MTRMEAAFASGVLKVAGVKLVSLITSEFASITGVKKHLCELEGKHQQISSWLAAVRDGETGSGTQLQRVKELRNVCYDIDDLLYEVHLEAEKHKIHSESDNHQQLANCFCAKPKSFLFRCKVARKIKAINVKYVEIVKQAEDANTIGKYLQIEHPVRSINRTAGELSMLSNVEDSKIPRRDQEKDEIIRKILEPNEGEDGRPMIISIVGLGGSGKTTLAKHICHAGKIMQHFKDSVFWVHVSQEFDVTKLIGKLFEAIVKEKSDRYVQQNMPREISNELGGKKFLLVLDDAWHQDKHDWEQLMVHLNSGAPGSKILITTRDRKVAEIVQSSNIFELGFLSEAESWSLFLKRSEWVEEDLGNEYIQVGKEILKRCGGVPLAIKTLGGILCEKKEISIWRAIRDSDLWTDKSINDSVLASLRLSFIHLADELKQCVIFCSIFPKGYKIYKDRLVRQWVAHGFINSMSGVQPEDVGCDYFDSLVKVGFLHDPSDFDVLSKEPAWKMHDLIHDLTRDILQDEVVTCETKNMTTNSTHRCRYLSLTSCTEKVDHGLFDKVHALYVCGGNPLFNKLVKKGCFVRSVTLHYTVNAPFPLFILKFEYLAYLEIRNLHNVLLPEAISDCWNLQSFHFINCSGFVTLPESIGKLKKMRTLWLRDVIDIESLPLSLGHCRDLQYLKIYSCYKLSMIPSSLGITNGSLKMMEIVNCHGLKLPSEFIGELSNLQTFSLSHCFQIQDLPATLSCPILCTLDLSSTKVTMLPQWVTTIGTLECINLEYCKELVELPKGIGKLEGLKVLNIWGCTKLRCMPSGIGQLTRLTQLGLFVVGCGVDDARISELENLDTLRCHWLAITNLKYLKDTCDAEKACLRRKNSIQNLVLDWSPSETDEEMVLDTEKDLGVLNDLEPPSQIEYLEIKGYRASCLPWWLIEQNDSPYCEGITIKQTVPGQFLSLTILKLSQFPNLKHMRGLLMFPSLKSLELLKMYNLEELWTTADGYEIMEEELRAQYCFPVLSELYIVDCPKLSTVKPYFPPSLENLCLVRNNLQLLSPSNFSHLLPPQANNSTSSCSLHSAAPYLRELMLEGMTGSSSGLEFRQHCSKLKTLSIEDCDDLTQLPESIRRLTFLQGLEITGCPILGMLPEWLGELCSLRDLDVSRAPMITSLPQSIGHLTSLESLELTYCDALTMLPECIGQLSALQKLLIGDCPNLQCLPRSIRRLTALQSLDISGCPALASRYEQGVGPDWHLVSHIPNVTFDDS